jgi:sporulation protein YlmC with PRC-barrel domain
MKKALPLAACLAFCLHAASVFAQQSSQNQPAPATGSSQSGQQGSSDTPVIGVIELEVVTTALSTKKDIMNKPVYNEQNDRIGKIDDIIITPGNAVSFAIIGVGGFLGLGKHDVVIPVNRIQSVNGKYVLPGATKAALKTLPAFKYKGT